MYLLKWQYFAIFFLQPNPLSSFIAHYQNAMAWGNISTWNHIGWFVRCGFTLEKRGKWCKKTWATNFGDMPNLTLSLARTHHPVAQPQPNRQHPFPNTPRDMHWHHGGLVSTYVLSTHPNPTSTQGLHWLHLLLQIWWQYKSHHTTSCYTNIWCRKALVGDIETEE
jgi:hypothetical protein